MSQKVNSANSAHFCNKSGIDILYFSLLKLIRKIEKHLQLPITPKCVIYEEKNEKEGWEGNQ